MQIGPTLIYKCPTCGSLLKNSSLISGNTFGAIPYSDGYYDAPMMRRYPNLTKCKACDSIFWLEDLLPIKEYSPFNKDDTYDNIPFAKFLNIEDLFRALSENKDKEREYSIRRDIWWTFNDVKRPSPQKHVWKDKKEQTLWQENCESLIHILLEKKANKIMVAELYRNIGHFEKCMAIIDTLPDDWADLKAKYKEECENHNTFVFLMEEQSRSYDYTKEEWLDESTYSKVIDFDISRLFNDVVSKIEKSKKILDFGLTEYPDNPHLIQQKAALEMFCTSINILDDSLSKAKDAMQAEIDMRIMQKMAERRKYWREIMEKKNEEE
jgi:hypothetical protein